MVQFESFWEKDYFQKIGLRHLLSQMTPNFMEKMRKSLSAVLAKKSGQTDRISQDF